MIISTCTFTLLTAWLGYPVSKTSQRDTQENEETMLKNSNELVVSDADQYDNRQMNADHKPLTKTY